MPSADEQEGPFCQSCGMPLLRPSDFGTGDAGVRVNDYCVFCYQDGRFTEPGLSKKMMVDRCVEMLVRRHVMTELDARALIAHTIPRLKRWRRARSRETWPEPTAPPLADAPLAER